jgi:hypothetical protein
MSQRDRWSKYWQLFLAIGGLSVATPGMTQGIPVVDASAIAAAQQNLQMLQQQLQQLQSLLSTAQGLAKSVGQGGALSVVLPQALSQSGLDQFSVAVASSLSGTLPGSQLQPVFSQIAQSKGLGASAAGAPDFSNFNATQQWVNNLLTTSPTASASAQGLGRQARGMVAGQSAANGYALALTARQQVSTMAAQTQSLASQVSSAATLRDDVAANTAVMLAVHDEMAEIQALLASLLAVQSSGQMADSDMSASTQQAANAKP